VKKLVVALAAFAVCTGAVGLSSAHADGESVTVPKAGPRTVSTTWTGTVPAGTNMDTFFTATDDCNDAQAPFKSEHSFNVAVAPGAYGVVKAKMSVIVDVAGFGSAVDYIELLDPAGNSVGVEKQAAEMVIEVVNPAPGAWKLLTCEFLPMDTGNAYTATVKVKTTCKGASPCPAPPKKRK
jgi:hypothetical protein